MTAPTPTEDGPMQLVPLRMPPDLWIRVQQAAREASAKEGADVSAAEWVRRTLEAKLRRSR